MADTPKLPPKHITTCKFPRCAHLTIPILDTGVHSMPIPSLRCPCPSHTHAQIPMPRYPCPSRVYSRAYSMPRYPCPSHVQVPVLMPPRIKIHFQCSYWSQGNSLSKNAELQSKGCEFDSECWRDLSLVWSLASLSL